MTEETTPETKPVVEDKDASIAALAAKLESAKPAEVTDKDWRKHRVASGNMVIIRAHFKSIYLIPMSIISLLCALVVVFADGNAEAAESMGLVWVVAFCLYMNMFIFEWSRAWTYALVASMVAVVAIGFALNSDSFPIWDNMKGFVKGLDFTFSDSLFLFFFVFFTLAASLSFLKTRLNYVVFESNEIQVYRNAWFGDRQRISMLNPRVEVVIPDMLEYFHPFYRAGSIIIHAPDCTIVLDNVLNIRRIERATDRLGSSLSVRVAPT